MQKLLIYIKNCLFIGSSYKSPSYLFKLNYQNLIQGEYHSNIVVFLELIPQLLAIIRLSAISFKSAINPEQNFQSTQLQV